MNRAELIMLDSYKRDEMAKRLKPILNWDEVKKGTEIFHSDSNDVYASDEFEGLNPTDTNIIIYKNREGKQYEMSGSGWYFYNEYIADEVEEMWTPKLYFVKGVGSNDTEDYTFIIACNPDHLVKCWNEKFYDSQFEDIELFMEEYEFYIIKECDDFHIKVE